MSKKRGLSLEEKRQKMLEIFFEKKTFFQLKELEKIAPKEKGITPMSVKEVVQSLVDDSMVDSEKIGTSIYFWAYPSKALHQKRQKVEQIQSQLDDFQDKVVANERKLVTVKQGKETTEERQEILSKLSALENENQRLKKELDLYRESDPEVLKEITNQTKVAVEATNRWTDNVFSIKSWCQKKFNIDGKDLEKQFDIPEDFDYIEE